MADLEQINDLAQETPDKNDSPSKWKGRLKLHRFLVFWLVGVGCHISGDRRKVAERRRLRYFPPVAV